MESTFGVESEPKDAILSGISSVAADDKGFVYVLDRKDNRLISFDPDGKVRWVSGRKGQGPGEFQKVRGMVYDGDQNLYISNIGGTRIDKFNLNGNFIKSYSLSQAKLSSVYLSGFIHPSTLVLTKDVSGIIGADIVLLKIGNQLEKQNEFRVDRCEGLQVPQGVGIGIGVKVIKEKIVVGHSHVYKLHFYDVDGKLKKVVARDFQKFVKPGILNSDNRWAYITTSSLSPPLQLKNGYLLNSAFWPTNISDPDKHLQLSMNRKAPVVEPANTLDLFNERGELLYSISREDSYMPELGRLAFIDVAGKLYTITDEPYPQVRRYNIKINH